MPVTVTHAWTVEDISIFIPLILLFGSNCRCVFIGCTGEEEDGC